MTFLSLASVAFLTPIAAAGCGGPKEAQDPRAILGDDLEHGGVSGGATTPDRRPAETRRDELPASRAECEAAARHLVELGIALAIRDESDPERRRQLESDRQQALESQRAQRHIADWTRDCLQRGDSQRVARCIAQAASERDVDRCIGTEP